MSMANTITPYDPLPIRLLGADGDCRVIPATVSIDTGSSDLTLLTPSAKHVAGIASIICSVAQSTIITFKSGSLTIVSISLAAGGSISWPIDGSIPLHCLQVGDALKVSVSVAPVSMFIDLVEFHQRGIS